MPDRKGAGQEQKLLEGGALRSGVRCSKGGVTLSSENLTTSFKASRWHAECHSARFTVEPLSNPTPIGSQPGFTQLFSPLLHRECISQLYQQRACLFQVSESAPSSSGSNQLGS